MTTRTVVQAEPEQIEEPAATEAPSKKRFNPFAKNVDANAFDEELKAQEVANQEAEAMQPVV